MLCVHPRLLRFLYPTDHEHGEKDKKITGANTRAEANLSSNGLTRIDRNRSPPFKMANTGHNLLYRGIIDLLILLSKSLSSR